MEPNTDEQTQKRVAFYSTLVNAWIQTRMEVDKTLIIISSAGIGFLITLLGNKGVTCTTDFIIYLAAFISFFIVIVLCVIIFQRNSSYVATLLSNPEAKDSYLDLLDIVAKFFFALALIFTLIIGISTGLNQLYNLKVRKGDQEMSEKKAQSILRKVDESLTGLNKLNPDKIDKKSLSGLGDLNPDKNTGNTADNDSTTQDSKDKKK